MLNSVSPAFTMSVFRRLHERPEVTGETGKPFRLPLRQPEKFDFPVPISDGRALVCSGHARELRVRVARVRAVRVRLVRVRLAGIPRASFPLAVFRGGPVLLWYVYGSDPVRSRAQALGAL